MAKIEWANQQTRAQATDNLIKVLKKHDLALLNEREEKKELATQFYRTEMIGEYDSKLRIISTNEKIDAFMHFSYYSLEIEFASDFNHGSYMLKNFSEDFVKENCKTFGKRYAQATEHYVKKAQKDFEKVVKSTYANKIMNDQDLRDKQKREDTYKRLLTYVKNFYKEQDVDQF